MTTTFDNHKNLAYSAVATAPSPATSGTSLVLTTGDGSKFPTPPFQLLMWPGGGATANQGNAEIARVTGIATDTLTIVRGQEGTTAQGVAVGWQVALTSTAKLLTDIEAAINATLGGDLTGTLPNPTIGANKVTQTGMGNAAAVVSTTSTSYVDLDATNAAVSLTTTGGDLLAILAATIRDETAGGHGMTVALALDGAAEVGAMLIQGAAPLYVSQVAIPWRFTGVAAGAHTIKGRWLTNASGDTIDCLARTLIVVELKH